MGKELRMTNGTLRDADADGLTCPECDRVLAREDSDTLACYACGVRVTPEADASR